MNDFEIPTGAADPFVNTATVDAWYDGYEDIPELHTTGSAEWITNLFQPDFSFTKEVDPEISKIGHDVTYTFTVTNTSSDDTPNLIGGVTDSMFTFTTEDDFNLTPGASHTFTTTHTITETDTDPLVNTATASASPDGFPNLLTRTASATVDLFEPEIDITLTGDALSKVGDEVTYILTVYNKSTTDTPLMNFDIAIPEIGYTTTQALDSGENFQDTISHTIPSDAPDPFVVTATATATPAGFANTFTESDSHSVNLFQPAIGITKTADKTQASEGEEVTYTITVYNNSSADTPDMEFDIYDSTIGFTTSTTLASSESAVYNVTTTIPTDAEFPFVNVVNTTASPIGFPNEYTGSDTWMIVSECHEETAWGYNEDYSIDFLDTTEFSNPKFNNWGWTNGPIDMTTDGSIELDLLAAAGIAGKNPDKYSNVENGIPVGTVLIEWTGGEITVTYTVYSGHKLEEVHLWIGNTKLPVTRKDKDTNAPGQFPYGGENEDTTWAITIDLESESLNAQNIYIAAHAVVCIPDTMNGESR